MIPFEKLPNELQATQQSDDLNLFQLETYYVLSIKKINSYADNGLTPESGIFFSDGNEEYISIFDRRLNPPIPQEIKTAQEERVEKDFRRMTSLLEEYDDEKISETNNRYREVWEKERERDHQEYNVTQGCIWRNIDNSFWAIAYNYTTLLKMVCQKSSDFETFF